MVQRKHNESPPDVTGAGAKTGLTALTASEREALLLVYQRLTVKDIARELSIAPESVASRIKRGRAKLGGITAVAASRLVHADQLEKTKPRRGRPPRNRVEGDDAPPPQQKRRGKKAQIRTIISDRPADAAKAIFSPPDYQESIDLQEVVDQWPAASGVENCQPENAELHQLMVHPPTVVAEKDTKGNHLKGEEQPGFPWPFPTKRRPINDHPFVVRLMWPFLIVLLINALLAMFHSVAVGLNALME